MIKINSIRNREVSKNLTESYNKSSDAKDVKQVNEDEVTDAIIELKEQVAEEEASVVEDAAKQVQIEPTDFGALEVEEETAEELSLDSMTKGELEDYARENLGLELDKRKKKSDLIAEIIEASK